MRRISVSRKELLKDYNSLTAKEAAKKTGVCLQTFYNMLDAAGIERKRKDFKRGESISYKIID